MNLDFDYHIHTIYSGHAAPDMVVGNIIKCAAEKGLKKIAIVEHVPDMMMFPAPEDGWYNLRNDRSHLDAILSEVEARKGDFPGMQVFAGAEVDADPFAMDGSLMLDDLSGLDFVIAATHSFPGGEAFWFDTVSLKDSEKRELFEGWLNWACKVARHPDVDVFAHPGTFVGANSLIPSFWGDWGERFLPFLEALEEGGVAFELNELISRKLPTALADSYLGLVKLAKKRGLKFSVGSDAHSILPIGQFEWVGKIINDAGIDSGDFFSLPR